jgi:hypothetical protein
MRMSTSPIMLRLFRNQQERSLMNQFNTVFGQLLQVLPWSDFERLVRRYGSDKYAKLMTTRRLFAGLIYAQARTKESLRDIWIITP